ncbi:MAG: hypothetical protein JWP29_5193 [Rhodoferax sp.]|nr:hypothetical protein [Rhodoferax sp.]
MGTIAISVEVLRTGAGGEEASDSALQILGRQNTRLEGVMATALELARALEGGALLSLRPAALGDLLAEVIRQLAPHGPRLSLRKTPQAWVEADPVYLSQAIRSLVAATLPSRSDDSGEPIEAWVEVAASQDDWVVRFAAHAAELDVPWVRLPAPNMLPPPRSPGLDGLLAHQLLLLHNGSLHIAYPHGSGFTLVLPRAAKP